MSTHSRYAPSAAARWLNCTASLKIAEQYEQKSSEFAAEGVVAHEVAASVLQAGTRAGQFLGQRIAAHGYLCEVTQEMVVHVNRYVDFVRSLGQEIGYVEHKVFFNSFGVPGGFGTIDYVTFDESKNKAIIVDLKYGKGIAVEAKDNPQLKLYALGVIQRFEGLYMFENIEVHIFQPRLDSHSCTIYSVKELERWAKTVVKPAVQQIETGKVQFGVGDWCTKNFCPARHECAARAAVMDQVVREELTEMTADNVLTGQQIADVLKQAEKLRSYLSDVETVACSRLHSDPKSVPGWKLVEGRSNRVWRDTLQVEEQLRKKRVKIRDMFQMKIKSPAQLEKTLSDRAWSKDFVAQHAHKPQGKPSLVEESDRREPYRLRAETEFDVLNNEKENNNDK